MLIRASKVFKFYYSYQGCLYIGRVISRVIVVNRGSIGHKPRAEGYTPLSGRHIRRIRTNAKAVMRLPYIS